MSAEQALELIQAGLAALAARDIDDHDAAALGEESARILSAVGGLQVEAARRLARFEALGGPAAEHAPSAAGWLGRRCRLRPWEARQLSVIAARLHLLDDTVTAFEAGEVAFGDLATIAEGIDTAAETMAPEWSPERIAAAAQPIMLEAATSATPGQLRKVAARIALTLDGKDAERRRRQIDRQAHLNLGQTLHGAATMRGTMGAADFAILEKAVDAFAPRPDPGNPRWRNRPGHRRLQGLISACQAALSAAGRQGVRERGGAPVRVHLIASPATVDPAVPATEAPPGRTEYGTLLTAAQVREMIDRHRAQVTRILVDGDGRVVDRFTADGRPLNWGRTRRLFSTAQRDVFLALYAGCAAEGCDRPPAWADIDHRKAWADGGRTDLDNGQPLCRWHNLEKERQSGLDRENRPPRDDQRGREPPDP